MCLTYTRNSHSEARMGRLQKSQLCWYHKCLRSTFACHLARKAGYHQVFNTKLLRRLRMVWWILLCEHLRTILSIVLVSDATALAWNWPWRDHLQHIKTCQLPRPAQSDPAAPFRYQNLILFHLTSIGNQHYQPAPWFTNELLLFSEDPPTWI